MLQLSVILPTYNPKIIRLNQALNGLKEQTLNPNSWEIVLVDNNSSNQFSDDIDLSWHPNVTVVLEPQQGLTFARMNGFRLAKGNIIVLVDDDNILDKNYLLNALQLFKIHPRMGAAGGKSIPFFESTQPPWLYQFYPNLALRNLGEKIIIDKWENKYPNASPLGAGMVIRKNALSSYIEKINSGQSVTSDRTGKSLSSGGDNDIVIEILKSRWLTGYFPSLSLIHIIPKERMSVDYLSRLNNNSSKSWIQLLESHGINPWKKIELWTVTLRKAKALFSFKVWNKVNYIKWQGACGMFDGLIKNN